MFSVLLQFVTLIPAVVKFLSEETPEYDSPKRDEKIEDLNLLFINMHHLINEFRPHQARETLRVMLHVQRRRRVQVADKFKEHLEKVNERSYLILHHPFSIPFESIQKNRMSLRTKNPHQLF